ncbi:hypothetical protein LDO26_12070 [Luteimonas sp. BDR2-5]|uniref:hypothetical protein n=1 Tax=Proluteimonas luteida TaxID=2878685 RepID=UPI001E3C4188|nr:hypothetical protein [Luteimonas sp. BDR2-5]MCD9028944.1 hypothetical protein [Luteimonas sp. BDR2-5]
MPPTRARRWPLAIALLLLGSLGIAAAWILVAENRNAQSSWMAVVAALDAAWLLRLARARPGLLRAALGTAATALAIIVASWGIVAAQLARPMGMLPWESALKLGPQHAWTLAGMANSAVDLAWFGAGLVIAAVLSR